MCICIYVYITLQRKCDLFDLQLNEHKNWALHLELPTGVPNPVVAFRNVHGPKL